MVYVVANDGQPLMPTERHGKVCRMLKSGMAKVIKITIFCYLMLVLKVGFNYWIYSIGLTILVINIFLLVMSRAEDNDDNDTENKAR